mmetsp:Transcript_32479/g.82515  ORF Transcript_32479/g.82515 Transcript_32479/m.82515 type:complete len:229 (+) Transcript_32479:1126-1812(+)
MARWRGWMTLASWPSWTATSSGQGRCARAPQLTSSAWSSSCSTSLGCGSSWQRLCALGLAGTWLCGCCVGGKHGARCTTPSLLAPCTQASAGPALKTRRQGSQAAPQVSPWLTLLPALRKAAWVGAVHPCLAPAPPARLSLTAGCHWRMPQQWMKQCRSWMPACATCPTTSSTCPGSSQLSWTPSWGHSGRSCCRPLLQQQQGACQGVWCRRRPPRRAPARSRITGSP